MADQPKQSNSLLRLPQVRVRYGNRCRSSLYLDIQKGTFVPPVPIGARAVAWIDWEVDQVIGARIAGATDDKLRALVAALVSRRGRQ